MGRPDAGAAAVIAAVLLLSACGAPEPAPSATTAGPGPTSTLAPSASPTASAGSLPQTPETVVDGLEAPWSIAFAEGSALVSERDSGRVLSLVPDGTRVVATIDGVRHGGEGGLLGLAVRDGALYVYSTADDGNRVERYPLRGGPGSWALGDPAPIIDGLPAAGNHNAGRIAFGPDGMLYVPVGDAGESARAQDPDSLNGKILRLTPDGSVPADNPFSGSPVYSLGHRNVQGLAWDEDGRLIASEFGQNTWDELNVIEPGGNYGWPVVEGSASRGDYIDPIAQWPTREASPSGIAVVDEFVVIANLRGEVLRSVSIDDPAEETLDSFAGEYGRLRDVVVAPDGALWILTNNTDGRGDPRAGDDRILRLSPAAVDPDD